MFSIIVCIFLNENEFDGNVYCCLRKMLQMSAYMLCAYLSILMFKMLFLQDNGNNLFNYWILELFIALDSIYIHFHISEYIFNILICISECIISSAVKRLIASKIKAFVYILYVCVVYMYYVDINTHT